jgi:dTMP kinase
MRRRAVRIVAIEGPSFAGKTTAISALAQDPTLGHVVVFDCYVRELADLENVPPPRTTSRAAQVAAFRIFMGVEQRRVDRAQRLAAAPEPADLLILDRSVDTLIAHTHALDVLYGYDARPTVVDLLFDLPHLVPVHTIYLDASGTDLRARRTARGEQDEYLLHDPEFLTAWRSYFLGSAGPTLAPTVTAVTANTDASELATSIRRLL